MPSETPRVWGPKAGGPGISRPVSHVRGRRGRSWQPAFRDGEWLRDASHGADWNQRVCVHLYFLPSERTSVAYMPDSLVERVVTIFITSISAYGLLASTWQLSSTRYCSSFPGELDLHQKNFPMNQKFESPKLEMKHQNFDDHNSHSPEIYV